MKKMSVKEFIKEQNVELEESKKLLGECFIFILKYDPEMTPSSYRANILTKIKEHLDGGTIQ